MAFGVRSDPTLSGEMLAQVGLADTFALTYGPVVAGSLTLEVPAKQLAARRKKWRAPKSRYPKGVLAKYAKLVSSASLGAVTDKR